MIEKLKPIGDQYMSHIFVDKNTEQKVNQGLTEYLQSLKKSKDESLDIINHPQHYNTGKIEVIDFIEDKNLNFHLGNVVKYVARAEHKGKKLEDLKKARWYLDREINKLEKENVI